MRCKCGGRIRITHSYSAGYAGKTSSGVCQLCERRFTFATVLVGEARGYGKGAAALARRLAAGKPLKIKEQDDGES